MKFIWLTNNYRVNLESIFSLERKYIPNNNEIAEWYNNYNASKNDILTNGIHFGEFNFEVKDPDNLTDDEQKFIHNYIIDIIGETPDKYIIEYYIILSTGLKMQISKDKFDIINETIDHL